MSIALVIPTAREEQILEFLPAWQASLQAAGVTTYVVEDNPQKTFRVDPAGYFDLRYLTWRDAPSGMLECINTKSPCCRQIGFWQAYQDGHEVIVTLDDDVRPGTDENPFLRFADILTNGLPLWIDPLLNYRSRGFPVENVGNVKVMLHVGSFLGVPDVDGETQLKHEKDFGRIPPMYISRPVIVPEGQLIPVNGGMCAFRREITPYLHYTSWCPELKYRRFDDIWMGIILKRWMDLCGLRMSYGPPFVKHIRASDAVKNMDYEQEGRKWNEVFWQKLDEELGRVSQRGSCSCDEAFEILTRALSRLDNVWARQEAESMKHWRGLFVNSALRSGP